MQWVSTLTVSLPSTSAEMPWRPCDALTMVEVQLAIAARGSFAIHGPAALDHEFHAGQPNPVGRDSPPAERCRGIGEVQHDFGARCGDAAEIDRRWLVHAGSRLKLTTFWKGSV